MADTRQTVLPDFLYRGTSGPAYTTGTSRNDQRYYAAQNQLKERSADVPWKYSSENYPFSIADLRKKISGVNQLSKFYFDIPKLRNESADRSRLVKRAWEKTTADNPGAATAIKNIYFYSENITIPMRGINTDPHIYANGYKFEAPIGTNYGDGDIAVTMIVDKDYYLYDFFMNWMNEIHSKDTGYFSFHNQYVTDIDIYQLNNVGVSFPKSTNFDDMIADGSASGFINYKVSLGNCYPKSVTAIEFKHEAANERTKITVGFTYEKIDYINPKKKEPEYKPKYQNINQLEDRYNLAGINIPPPPVEPPPQYDPTKDPSLNFGGQGLDPTSLRGPEYNTNDYFAQQQEYYNSVAPGYTIEDGQKYFVGPHESFDPYADNNMPFPTPEQFQAVRTQNIAETLNAEIDNVYDRMVADNPPQYTYDEDSMRWSPNPEYRTPQQMRNAAVEEVFNYRREQLTVDPTVLQEEVDRQLEDIQEHQRTTQYFTDDFGFSTENPNYDDRTLPGETEEEFAHRMALQNLGYSDVPDLEEFIVSEPGAPAFDSYFNTEAFANFIATNVSNEEVLDQFNTGLPAGLRPTDRPTSSPRSAEDIYEDLKEINSGVPEFLTDDFGMSTRNPDYRTDDELWEEAAAEAAGWTHGMGQGGQHHVGARTVKVSSEQDGMVEVPAALLDDQDPRGFINYAQNLYESGGPDIRPAAQKHYEWVDERILRQQAHVYYENSDTNKTLRNLIMNIHPGVTANDIVDGTLQDNERIEIDMNNPRSEEEKVIVALAKRLEVADGAIPLNRREQDLAIDIINEKFNYSIPSGTDLYGDPTSPDHVTTDFFDPTKQLRLRGKGFDPRLYHHFQEQLRTETPEENDAQIETLNQTSSALEDLVNNLNANRAISTLNSMADLGQQIEDARIDRIQQNYRDTVNTPTRRGIRDAMDERLHERINNGGSPYRTADEQRCVDATYDTVMNETDVTTYCSVIYDSILREEEAYYQGLQDGLTPQELGVNAHFTFAQHLQNTGSSDSNSASGFPATVAPQDLTPEQRITSWRRTLEQKLRDSQRERGWISNSDISTEQLRMQAELRNFENAGPDERQRITWVVNAFVRENRENKL